KRNSQVVDTPCHLAFADGFAAHRLYAGGGIREDERHFLDWKRLQFTVADLNENIGPAGPDRLDLDLGHGLLAVKMDWDRFGDRKRARWRCEPPERHRSKYRNGDRELGCERRAKRFCGGFAFRFKSRHQDVTIGCPKGQER